MAVIATVLTMSVTVHPRLRSLTGLFRPCMTGPIATAPDVRCTALYVLLPVFKSGNTNTVACPATGLSGSFFRATFASTAASYWIGPSTISSGARCRTSAVACRTFSTSLPVPDAPVRVGQHGHSWLDIEHLGRLRGTDGDIGQLLGGWPWDHRAIAVHQHAIFQAHQKHTGDHRDTGPSANDLEGGPNRVGRCMRGAGHHAVGQLLVDHHGAEVGYVLNQVACLDFGQPLVLAQRDQVSSKLGVPRRLDRIDDLGLGQVQPQRGDALTHLVLDAQQA